MTGRTTALLALSSASVVLASGCGGDRVDRRDLESKVSDFILRQTGTTATVHCPKDVDPDKGHKTTCIADLSGTPTNLQIVFTSKGRFQVHVDTSHLG
ncbi:DUF4333 domain-containing protein [Conexibacter woesei]|uniref:DUF4333 domain-containing protein n=1 Tax=Conexibacter woesei TaxID=191495 RepID=UPI00047D714D|nr:DUF4333 domain-containing protein [Conexibacter woesei]